MRKSMTDDQLLALLGRKISQAVGAGETTDTISKDRLRAEKYYRGEPFGDEEEGKSQVVSRDVAEAIDSMMPPLMKIFSSGDEVCTFAATQESEEPAAAQATDFVNWVWSQQNDGYLNFHTWFKDGLLKRLGTIKIWWEPSMHYKRETYQDLPDDEFYSLLLDDDLELIEHDQRPDAEALKAMLMGSVSPLALPAPNPGASSPGPNVQPAPGAAPAPVLASQQGALGPNPALDQMAGGHPMPMLHDAVFRRKHDVSQIRVVAVPPDETLIDPQSGADEMPWGNRRRISVGDLIQEFPDFEDAILGLSSDGQDFNAERLERFADEAGTTPRDPGNSDPLAREVWVVDAYIPVDFDGDGIAEFRKITTAGASSGVSLVLENIEYDDNPFACVSPILLPHKLIGMSIADQTMDIQLIKSTLLRQGLNNVYLQNGSELAVTGEWDIEALLNRRPGNIMRGKPGATIQPLAVPEMLADIMQSISYFDTVRDQRTGSSRVAPGPGADSLNNAYTQTAAGASMVETAGQERVAYYARTFAETGVKRAFRRIFELACKHVNKPQTVKLRGQWVSINPAEWNERMQMAVTVGLGTNNKSVVVQQLMTLITQVYGPAIQLQQGIDGPLVYASGVHHALTKMVEAMGFKGADSFFPDPAQQQQPQKPPQPNEALVKANADLQKTSMTTQSQERIASAKVQSEERMAQLQAAVERELGYAKIAVDNRAINGELELKSRQHETDTLFKTHDAHLKTHAANHAVANDVATGQRADQKQAIDAQHDALKLTQTDQHFHATQQQQDRQFGASQAAAKQSAEISGKPPQPPRGLKGVSLVHDASGVVSAAKRHFDDGTDEEIPITREPAPPATPEAGAL